MKKIETKKYNIEELKLTTQLPKRNEKISKKSTKVRKQQVSTIRIT